jgi:hypothetical protein
VDRHISVFEYFRDIPGKERGCCGIETVYASTAIPHATNTCSDDPSSETSNSLFISSFAPHLVAISSDAALRLQKLIVRNS